MRNRHRIVAIESQHLDDRSLIDRPHDSAFAPTLLDEQAGSLLLDDVELIDETFAPRPSFPVLDSPSAPDRAHRERPSAVPGERPSAVRPSLPWGLGTDGWPRHNSRLVRLFACEPAAFVDGVAGGTWRALRLGADVRVLDDDTRGAGEWPRAIGGELDMPYLSPSLAVELRCQPFHARYTRVDIVVMSHCRWPRRFFDVASICLTEMQRLERPMTSAA